MFCIAPLKEIPRKYQQLVAPGSRYERGLVAGQAGGSLRRGGAAE